jgi:HD-GYP domain-containing protein (c-di-GMP phosphodiesterase class II)
MSVPEALDELARNRGTQFDAAVVDALTAVVGRTASASVVPRAA